MATNELTVIVLLRSKQGKESELLAALKDDRRDTLAHESGCRRFSILASDDPGKFVLHEIYDSEQAFEAHKSQPHFAAFERAVLAYCTEEPCISVVRPID